MKIYEKKAYLSNEVIEQWVEDAVNIYKEKSKKRADDPIKLSLSLEEIFLRFQETYGTEEMCHFVIHWHLGKVSFVISQKGARANCIEVEEEMENTYNILVRLGEKPEYHYIDRRNLNKVTYDYKKKPRKNSMLIQIAFAILLAVICSSVLRSIPGTEGVTECLTKAVFPKLCAILSGVATPLVFVAVIGGIAGLGDSASFGKIGSRVCLEMLKGYGVAVVSAIILIPFLFPITLHAAGAEGGIGLQLVNLVLDIVPNNLFAPFVQDNALQVIVVAIFVGFVVLLLGDKVKGLKNILDELSTLVYAMMGIICKLIPAIVFLGIYNLLANSEISTIISMYKMFILMFAGGFLVVLYQSAKTVLRVKVPYKNLFKKMSPTLVINLTTSSQVSALPENMICCKEKFGLDEKMVDFGLPLGIVTYMPVGAIFMISTVLGLAFIFHQTITLIMVIKALLLSVIVAIAAPPIPGSALVVMPILLSSCGLPTEYMSLGMIYGTIAGYFLPAFNGYLLQLVMLNSGKTLKMIDEEKLKREVSN
ncbi:MAG: cation:dicarboxylase symporter family transporter [Eubacteriales bacterium]|nr:cation:dicarboxylase symporter family transporter [Eubacteriales bacterium]